MAASEDWVKVEKSTARKPEVLQIAAALGLHPDHAFGICVRFWMWVDDNLSRECRAMSATESVLDAIIGRDGFTSAMISAGWLEVTDTEIRIPNFERHLSKSSKKRAENSRRQRECRADEGEMSRGERDKSATESVRKARPDKEKIKREKERDISLGDSATAVIETNTETIYQAYPRKVAKPAALKAIRLALKAIDAASLLALTEAYAEARRGADPQFTPHPATWFNSQRWADDPETWKQHGPDSSGTRAPPAGREQERIARNFGALADFAAGGDAGPMFASRLRQEPCGADGVEADG